MEDIIFREISPADAEQLLGYLKRIGGAYFDFEWMVLDLRTEETEV